MKMNIIKLLIFVCSCMFLHDIQSAQSVAGGGASAGPQKNDRSAQQEVAQVQSLLNNELADLLQLRIENIVILNDTIEELFNKDKYIFIGHNPQQHTWPYVVLEKLIRTLLEHQTVICNKSIFKNFIFLKNIFIDLLNLDADNIDQFRLKYGNSVANMQDDELLIRAELGKKMKDYSLKNDSMLEPDLDSETDVEKKADLKKKIALDKQIVFNQKNEILKLSYFKNLTKIQRKYFTIMFFYYKAYDLIYFENNYCLYEINEHYILLLPKSKIEKIKQFSLDYQSIYLGLNLSLINFLTDTFDEAIIQSNVSDYTAGLTLDLGASLQDAITKVFVNKQSFKQDVLSDTSYLLPKFNIFIIGHGSEQPNFLGINEKYMRSLFMQFNNRLCMKTLILFSCYPGGQRFKRLFDHSMYSIDQFSEKLKYTIITVGSFVSSVQSYLIKYNFFMYGDYLDIKFFENVFDCLSLDNENIEHMDYQKIFQFLNMGGIANYCSIKFPNTGWTVSHDYDKDFFNINSTKVLSHLVAKKIEIPVTKKVIILNENIIPLELFINLQIEQPTLLVSPVILPTNYMFQDYYFSKINVHVALKNSNVADNTTSTTNNNSNNITDIIDFGSLISKLFMLDIMEIRASIYILIEQMDINFNNTNISLYKIFIDIKSKKIYYSINFDSIQRFFVYDTSNKSLLEFDYTTSFVSKKDSIISFREQLNKRTIDNTRMFIDKLENLPKTVEQLPKLVQESSRIYQQAQRQGLNVQARPFLSKSMKQSKKGLNIKAKPFDIESVKASKQGLNVNAKKFYSKATSVIPQSFSDQNINYSTQDNALVDPLRQSVKQEPVTRRIHNPYAKILPRAVNEGIYN